MIPDNILLKPTEFTDEEYTIMKTHTTQGCDLVEKVADIFEDDAVYKDLAYKVVRWHHERDDGRGYPDGLKGADIPICAQIVSVADVFDALINDRCYKKAFPLEVAREMILTGKCGKFSAVMLVAFENCYPQMCEYKLVLDEITSDDEKGGED